MYQLKWLLKRFGFLKRIFFEFIDRLIYQKHSQALLHSWNAHRTPFKAILFYNFLGRILWACKEVVFKKSLKLEGYNAMSNELEKTYACGNDDLLWPKSPMIELHHYKLDDLFCQKIIESLAKAYQLEQEHFDKTTEWERIADNIKESFLDKNGLIIKEHLINFRNDPIAYQELFNDQFHYLDVTQSYTKSYLKSIDLILEYHRSAQKIDKALLASVSESAAGNNHCVQYRGKRVSEKSLFHTVVVNDIIKMIPFSTKEEKSVILDIGSGYGALSRILRYYTPNSCHILLDLPETLIMTSYFIKYNFPNAKIALLEDIIDGLDHFDTLVKTYDFIIIPPSVLTALKMQSVDLVINTASMGFMQKEYLEFYLSQIDRVLKVGGYFYSLNKEYNDHWGIGMYQWDFKASYVTRLFEYNNRFSYPQWLGQKVK